MTNYKKQSKIYFISNPYRIDDHDWRVLVKDFCTGGRCSEYQFRTAAKRFGGVLVSAGDWQKSHRWPSYDANKAYSGLPRSIAKLYEREYSDIQAHLSGLTLFDGEGS